MPKKILIIDDEELVVRSLVRYLKGNGYEAESAQSGEEAVRKAEGMLFDLVVVDMRMPGISGIETLKRLRVVFRDKYSAKVPEIIITGYASDNAYQEAEELGVVDYIYKPFENSMLIEAVKRNLGQS